MLSRWLSRDDGVWFAVSGINDPRREVPQVHLWGSRPGGERCSPSKPTRVRPSTSTSAASPSAREGVTWWRGRTALSTNCPTRSPSGTCPGGRSGADSGEEKKVGPMTEVQHRTIKDLRFVHAGRYLLAMRGGELLESLIVDRAPLDLASRPACVARGSPARPSPTRAGAGWPGRTRRRGGSRCSLACTRGHGTW